MLDLLWFAHCPEQPTGNEIAKQQLINMGARHWQIYQIAATLISPTSLSKKIDCKVFWTHNLGITTSI